MQLLQKPLSWFKPDPANPRQHPEAQLRKLENAIRKFGFRFPIVADRNGRIVAGHGRLEAARRIGLASVPCVVLEDIDERAREALALLDNRVPLDATWDHTLLLGKIRAILESGDDVQPRDIGLDPDEIDRIQRALAADSSGSAPVIDASGLLMRFVAVVSGPIQVQPEALRVLEQLADLEGVEIQLSEEIEAL